MGVYTHLELDLKQKMLNFTALSKQFAVAALQRPVSCAGYWLENSIGGFATSNIEHDPMQMASFYKESGN